MIDAVTADLNRYMREQDEHYRFEIACENEKADLMKLTLNQLEDSVHPDMWAKIDEVLEEIAAENVMDRGTPYDEDDDYSYEVRRDELA